MDQRIRTDPGEAEARRFLVWSFVFSALSLVFIAGFRASVRNFFDLGEFGYLFLNHDYWGAWLTLGMLAVAAISRNKLPVRAVVTFVARHPGYVAAAAFLFFCAGTLFAYHDYPLSMDEHAARFQSEAFASGHLTGKFPVALIDWLIPKWASTGFLLASGETGEVASVYLPGFALLLTPFTFLGIPWACNPAIGALSLLALHRLARELTSNEEAGGWAMLFALASPAFTVNAMSYYSMPAHLLLNLVFTLLLLRATPAKAFFAGLVGGLALVLHNPFPHALYALPWIVWILYRRDYRILGALLLGYLPLSTGLGLGWSLLKSGIDTIANVTLSNSTLSAAGQALEAWLTSAGRIFQLPNGEIVVWRVAGVIKLWLWAVPGLLLLAWFGYRSRRGNALVRLLFASAILTFFGYFIIPFSQDLGWGYRYFHSAWGVLPVLAAIALTPHSGDAQSPTRLIAIAGFLTLASLVLSTALRVYQVEGFIDRHLKQIPPVSQDNPTITFVDIQAGYISIGLVQNHPIFPGKRLIMVSHGSKRNEELVRKLDPSARQTAIGPWGETWELKSIPTIEAFNGEVGALH